MSLKKSIDDQRGRVASDTATVREKQEARVFELGKPARPQFLHNNRPLYEQYKKYEDWLYKKNLLAYSDGDALLELSEAEVAGQKERKTKGLAHWQGRKPFPAPIVAGNGIKDFIQKIVDERDSFRDRLRPEFTLLFDIDGTEYEFPEGDASTIARTYAQWAVSSDDTGELIKRQADKFLHDLNEGHNRGIFYDAVCLRNIVTFAKEFGGLPGILPWEIFVLAALAFKRASGLRVTTELWLSVGRKNGKTRLAATVGMLLLVADLEKYAEIYVCSTAKEQSRICWRDAKRIVGDSPELLQHVKRWAGELHVESTDSKMQALASEERSFLGVRASGIIADEVGVWENRDAWDAIVQSTVSKSQPLTLAITTAPQHRQTFAFEKFSWCEKILRGIVQADHVAAFIYRIDDGDDPMDIKKLRKANPSLGTILPEEHIKKQIDELADSPSGLSNFLQFHANLTPERTLQRQGSINAKRWDACAAVGRELIGETDCAKATAKFLELNLDTPCYLGIDIGIKNDLTAVALLFPKARFAEGAEPIDKIVCTVQCFAPEEGLLEKERSWGVPLSTWARTDFLQLLPGDMIDLRVIKEYVIDCCTKFQVRECGFDPWQFPQQAAELNESSITCVAVPQVPSQLTAPCQELLGAVQRGNLVHFGSPILGWMAANVVMQESDKHSGIKPDKLTPSEKIDGISAVIMAWHRYLSNPPHTFRPMFLYDDPAHPGSLIDRNPLTGEKK